MLVAVCCVTYIKFWIFHCNGTGDGSSVLGQTWPQTLYDPSHCKEFCPSLFAHATICWKYSTKDEGRGGGGAPVGYHPLSSFSPADISIDAHQCLETVSLLMNTLLHDHNSAKWPHKGQYHWYPVKSTWVGIQISNPGRRSELAFWPWLGVTFTFVITCIDIQANWSNSLTVKYPSWSVQI